MKHNQLTYLWVAVGLLFVGGFGLYLGVVANTSQKPIGSITGPDFLGPYWGVNGLKEMITNSATPTGAGTTTLVSIQNPWVATSTVNFFEFENTLAATSSYSIACGPAGSGAGAPDLAWIQTSLIATSTSFQTIFSNSTSTSANGPGGFMQGNAATNTIPYWGGVNVGPKQFFVCQASGSGGQAPLGNSGGWDSAFTNNPSSFNGTYKIRWVR